MSKASPKEDCAILRYGYELPVAFVFIGGLFYKNGSFAVTNNEKHTNPLESKSSQPVYPNKVFGIFMGLCMMFISFVIMIFVGPFLIMIPFVGLILLVIWVVLALLMGLMGVASIKGNCPHCNEEFMTIPPLGIDKCTKCKHKLTIKDGRVYDIH